MALPSMNEFQVCAFWVWFQSAFNGKRHERSFSGAAKRLGVSDEMIRRWHAEFRWDDLAAEKDAEVGRRIEREVVSEIVRDFKKALERQQELTGALMQRFKTAIEEGDLELKVADLLKLMEFETNYIYGEQRGLPQGNLLGIVLGAMKPEARTEFNAAVERSRDRLQLTGVGSAGRN